MRYCAVLIACCLLWGCAPNNVTEDASLDKVLAQQGVRGSFALLDNATNNFTVHNLKRYRDSAYFPAATFHILTGLAALQTGILESDTARNAGGSGMSFNAAFSSGNEAFFENLVQRLHRDTLQHWMDTVAYGNKKIGADATRFWMQGPLTIRPDEQMGFVKRLYFNQLPFHQINQEAVKRAMLAVAEPLYRLSYKTGETRNPKTSGYTGWVVGFLEENKHPYFFVLHYDAAAPANGPAVLRALLEHLGYLRGKK